MATITLRGKQQYQAEIRRKGHPQQTKTFLTKAQAEAWARTEEARMATVTAVVDSFGGNWRIWARSLTVRYGCMRHL